MHVGHSGWLGETGGYERQCRLHRKNAIFEETKPIPCKPVYIKRLQKIWMCHKLSVPKGKQNIPVDGFVLIYNPIAVQRDTTEKHFILGVTNPFQPKRLSYISARYGKSSSATMNLNEIKRNPASP